MNAQIETLVRLFVRKEKRERMLALAAHPKRRSDFCHALLHDPRSLDPGVLVPLPPHGSTIEVILRALRPVKAADPSYCISERFDADDREMPVGDALALVVGRAQDSLVFVQAARLAYYENHEGEQYVLRAKA